MLYTTIAFLWWSYYFKPFWMLRAGGIQICLALLFLYAQTRLYVICSSYLTSKKTNQAYPLQVLLGHFCNTLLKESLVLPQLSMPSLNLFSCGCFERLHAFVLWACRFPNNYFFFCNCYFTKLDSWKFKNYNPNYLILHLLIQEQSAWKFTSAQCQGSLVNSSLEYLTSINVQQKLHTSNQIQKGIELDWRRATNSLIHAIGKDWRSKNIYNKHLSLMFVQHKLSISTSFQFKFLPKTIRSNYYKES